MKKFTSSGIVWGNYWGGGSGGYKATIIKTKSLKTLLKKAEEMLKNGSLDSGMGFENLNGAYLNIKIEDIKIINDKEYIYTSYQVEIIGELEEEEIDISLEADLYA